MNANDTTIAALENGEEITVTLTDGTTIEGTFISVNSKGLNMRVDDKVVTRSLARVEKIDFDAVGEDEDVSDEMSESSEDGYTSADLADMFNTSARALRRRLRALGMGVGKGSRYFLNDDQLVTVRASVEGEPIED